MSNRKKRTELSNESHDKAVEIFGLFKKDESMEVNEERFVNHWASLQARMAATDYFAQMDVDESGSLTEAKFLEFWRRVKEQGITDDEIIV